MPKPPRTSGRSRFGADRFTVTCPVDQSGCGSPCAANGRVIHLSSVADTVPAVLRSADGLSVRLQLLSARDRVVWPTERRALVQRYADAPAAELLVPTLPAFAASKTATWADRHAARDLWDLWALSKIGAIDAAAARLYRRHGPTNRPPA